MVSIGLLCHGYAPRVEARRTLPLLPLAVFLFALLVRLPGLGWGLHTDLRNASLHPDETPNFGYSQRVVPALGRFTPGFYNYGTLYLTAFRVASDVATGYTGGPKTKEGFSWTEPTKTDWEWVSRCILAARVVSLLAGAATALVAFLLARRVAGTTAGILAALFISVAPAHVVHSRFATPDILASALIGAALLYAVRSLDPPDGKARLSPAVLCGLFAGLSASVKYTGVLVLLSLYVALASQKQPGWPKQALLGTAAAIIAFLLTTPGVLLETSTFVADFTYEMRHTATGQELFFAGTSSGFVYHLANLSAGIGLVLALMGLAGLLWAAYRRHPWAFALLAFMLPYYLLIGRAEVKFMRYTFPLYIGLAVGFGYAVSVAQRKGLWSRAAVGGAILGIGGLPGGGLHDTVPLTLGMLGEDPRDSAGRTLSRSVGLARDPWYWSATVVPDGAAPRSAWPAIRREILESASPRVIYPLTGRGAQTYFDLRLFDAKPERIATSNFEIDYPERLRDRKDLTVDETARVAAANRWTDRLESEYAPDRLFGPLLGREGVDIGALSPQAALALAASRTSGVEDMDYVRAQVIVWKRKTP